jgi:hypothetical protein
MGLLRESSSRERRATVVYVTLAVLFVALYVILFPQKLRPELTLVPKQAFPLVEIKGTPTPGGMFFALGGWEGYWSGTGDLQRLTARRPQAVVSATQVAWYDAPHNQVVVEGASGPVFTLPGEQFPYWSHDRLYTIDGNRLGLKAWSTDGKLLWSKQTSSLITAMDSTRTLTVLGTLDGRVTVLGPKGDSAGGFQPGGSRLPVVYNVAAAPSSQSVLVLAGVDPKRFLVLEKGGSDFRPVFHKPLKDSRPWPTPLGFINGGALAYYENESNLVFLDPRSPERETTIPLQGNLAALETLSGGRLVAFVQSDGHQADFRIASLTGTSVMDLPFETRDVLLKLQGGTLLLGADQTLLTLEVKVQ